MSLSIKNGMKCVLLAAAVSLASVSAAQTSPVQTQAAQVPGYYKMRLGDFVVTALYDGAVAIPQALLNDINAEEANALLSRMSVPLTEQGVQTAVNAYVVEMGNRRILVDSGAAQCFGAGLGNIGDNLSAAGYAVADIDTVLLTHLHPDHVCGINDGGRAVFPNAMVYVDGKDADYWLSREVMAAAPAEAQSMFRMSQESVAPYEAAGKLRRYDAGDTLLEGVEAVSTPGHTPGHASYLFSSNGDTMLIWGDIVHSHAVQFRHPEVSLEFDSDKRQAVQTRKDVFARTSQQKLWVAGAHLPFPGIGHVVVEPQGYRWVPVEYAPLR